MNSGVEAVYRDNAIVTLGHYPGCDPDGAKASRIRLDQRTTVRISFLSRIYHSVREACPYLVHEHQYCLKDLLDPDSWASMDNHERRLAGRCLAWLVRNGHLPFEFVPRQRHKTGTYFYYYVSSEEYQGGD
jgi:hypothetical protein